MPLLWGRWEEGMQGQEEVGVTGRDTEACLIRGRGPALQMLSGCDTLGAFYSEKLPGQSGAGRVVVLNTNLYYSNNEQTAGMVDPGQQFQWLEEVLTNASRAKEMVRLLPPPATSLGWTLNTSPTPVRPQPLARGA